VNISTEGSRAEMIIAVAISKPERISNISDVFGKSFFFLLHNAADKSEVILSNPFASELGGGGIQSAKLLIENCADVLIVKQIGRNPFRFLSSAKIKIYQSAETTASDAIRHFAEGKLNMIGETNKDNSFGRKRKRSGKKFIDKKYVNDKKGNI